MQARSRALWAAALGQCDGPHSAGLGQLGLGDLRTLAGMIENADAPHELQGRRVGRSVISTPHELQTYRVESIGATDAI